MQNVTEIDIDLEQIYNELAATITRGADAEATLEKYVAFRVRAILKYTHPRGAFSPNYYATRFRALGRALDRFSDRPDPSPHNKSVAGRLANVCLHLAALFDDLTLID
jgi:RecB family exonuclease